MNWRIVTGYYITALGQESERYYFKTTDETIKVGDVGLTFYQNNQLITAIPYLPVVGVYEFNPELHNRLEDYYLEVKDQLKELADINYVQSSIFDFMEDN